MCPSAPLLDIDASSTDEEVLLFLGGRRIGDPIPINVITEVNPFSIEPWDSPEDTWYLFNSEDSQSHKREKEIKSTREGYWKLMGHDLKIMTSTSSTLGRKMMREFYVGQAPLGNRTGWMMHEYQAELKAIHGFIAQDYSSLCRVFWQSNQNTNYGEQLNPVASDDVDGEYLESMLLCFLDEEEEEENNCCLQDAAIGSEEVGIYDPRKLATSGRSPQCSVSNDSAESMQDMGDFSKEDYLELDDICSIGTSSSSSDNSSLMSLNSDEYFDVDALLRDLETENGMHCRDTTEGQVDCRFSISASARSSQVVIRPLPSASVRNTNNSLADECGPSNAVPGNVVVSGPACSSSEVELFRQASSSIMSQGSRTNRTHSGSSQGSSSSQWSGSRSVGRIAKLGKRYCCFGSFQ